MNRKDLIQLFKTAFKGWQTNNAALRAAALTFFIILPLPSLLLIVIEFFSIFYGQTQATQQLIHLITSLAGPAVAQLFSELLQSAKSPFTSVWASIIAIGFTVGGAIGAFATLRDTMDAIWQVKFPSKQKLTVRVKQKIGPFAVFALLGFLVIASTGFATIIFRLITIFSINGTLTRIALVIGEILSSFALATMLFAVIYKLIPQAKVHWIDVGWASLVTGIAFTVLNYIFGSYVQTFTVTSVIGAAGSLIIILLWIYILNLIILFGAETSKAYATIFSRPHGNHMPSTAQRIVEPLEKAGERLEEATKGPVIEPSEKEIEKPAAEAVAVKETTGQIEQAQEPEKGSFEVSVKIKAPQKKKNKKEEAEK
jgi:membrane protein